MIVHKTVEIINSTYSYPSVILWAIVETPTGSYNALSKFHNTGADIYADYSFWRSSSGL